MGRFSESVDVGSMAKLMVVSTPNTDPSTTCRRRGSWPVTSKNRSNSRLPRLRCCRSLEPSGAGTRVTMTATVEGRGLRRLLAPVVTREMRKSTVAALAALQTHLGAP